MRDYYMRGIFMGDVSDIHTMREKGVIGLDLKPDLLRGSVIIFWNDKHTGAVWVRIVGGAVLCRHTCHCGMSPEEMRIAAYNVAHTQYQDYEVQYIEEPFYSVEECGKAYDGEHHAA